MRFSLLSIKRLAVLFITTCIGIATMSVAAQGWVTDYSFPSGNFTNNYNFNAFLSPTGPMESYVPFNDPSGTTYHSDPLWRNYVEDTDHSFPANIITAFPNSIMYGWSNFEPWTSVGFKLYRLDANGSHLVSKCVPIEHGGGLLGSYTYFMFYDYDIDGNEIFTRVHDGLTSDDVRDGHFVANNGYLSLIDFTCGYNDTAEEIRWSDQYYMEAFNPNNESEIYEYTPVMTTPCTKLVFNYTPHISEPYNVTEDGVTMKKMSYMLDFSLTCDIPQINGKTNEFRFYRVWRVTPDGKEVLLNEEPDTISPNHTWAKSYSELNSGKADVSVSDIVQDQPIGDGETYYVEYIVRLYEHCNNMCNYYQEASNNINSNENGGDDERDSTCGPKKGKFTTYFGRFDADGIIERRFKIPFTNQTPTAIREVTIGEPVKTTYYNLAGTASDKPFDGINIVVTEDASGMKQTSKLIF